MDSAEIVKAERERLRSIMLCAEAKDRQALALSIATDTDLSAEQAARLLATAPKQLSQASGSQLGMLMARIGNPQVGVDGDFGGTESKASLPDGRKIYEARAAAPKAA